MTKIEREAEELIRQQYGDVQECDRPFIQRIAEALARLSRPPAGFVRDEAGVDRRVLGTLPVTKDGCVAGDGARIIFPQPDGSLNYEHVCTRGVLGPIQSGFSTPDAAEAAAEKERGQ